MLKVKTIEDEIAKYFDEVDLSSVSTKELLHSLIKFSHPSIVSKIIKELQNRMDSGRISEYSPDYPAVLAVLRRK